MRALFHNNQNKMSITYKLEPATHKTLFPKPHPPLLRINNDLF
jgi:hypothetical protein